MTNTLNSAALLLAHRARALENHFQGFVRAAWPILEPGTPFIGGRHIDAVCEYLTAVRQGQIRKLIINQPPRTSKSTLATIMLPAWSWAQDDGKSRWMFCSYSASLSTKHSVDRRTILTSDWYQKLWPQVQISPDQNEKARFSSTNRGHMLALSTGGVTTGLGGDFLIIDDPHSASEAQSDAERTSAIRYLRQTLMTRLDDPRTGRIVLVMQRLHELDASGELLQDGNWTHLCLPAIAEKKQLISLPITKRVIVREEGDVLEPERLSLPVLEDLKRSMGSLAYSGQMQQTPAPAEGALFKRSWWQRYSIAPPTISTTIQSWDCAFKDNADSDFVVGQVWGFDGAQAYLLDQVRRRMSYTATKESLRALFAKWPRTSAVLIEDKANGSAIISELKREIPGVIAVNPEGGKLTRAWAVTAAVEAGQIYLPENAPWVEDFLLEFSTFPNAAHDDQVDALSQALNWQRSHNFSIYSRALRNDELFFDLNAMSLGFGNCGTYKVRAIAIGWGAAVPLAALEVIDDGERIWILREHVSDPWQSEPKTPAAQADDLIKFASGIDPANPDAPPLPRSRPRDARFVVADRPETETFRDELLTRGVWVCPVEDEVLTGIERLGVLFERSQVRISSDCRQTIRELRSFGWNREKAARGIQEPVSTDCQTVEAFRLFCLGCVHPWRLLWKR